MKRRFQHSGFSMVEMLIAITISSTLFMLAVLWINETMKFSGRITDRQRQHSRLIRLDAQFRRDVRQSRQAKIQDDNVLILDQGPDRQATYRIEGSTLHVQRRHRGNVWRDRFQLTPATRISWLDGLPHAVGLLVVRANDNATPRGDQLQPFNKENQSSEHLPVDLHVLCGINRWPVEYLEAKSK